MLTVIYYKNTDNLGAMNLEVANYAAVYRDEKGITYTILVTMYSHSETGYFKGKISMDNNGYINTSRYQVTTARQFHENYLKVISPYNEMLNSCDVNAYP